jgi:hypothetical protein
VVGLAPFRRKVSSIAITFTAGALDGMCVKPVLAIEQSAKQQRDLPMMISFGTGAETIGHSAEGCAYAQ